jgi:formylmethanofuran dehydrogenase subunit E
LGVRIGLAGAAALELNVPRKDKRLLVILETDGCFADGVQVATGCTVGHRTLRVEDYGKVAATFVDVHSGQAVRIAPRLAIRELANLYAPGEDRHYFAQLQAYQTMPDEQLLSTTEVSLNTAAEVFLSRPGVRVNCAMCGEEIINERQVIRNGIAYCRACVGQAYYQQTVPSLALPLLCASVGA